MRVLNATPIDYVDSRAPQITTLLEQDMPIPALTVEEINDALQAGRVEVLADAVPDAWEHSRVLRVHAGPDDAYDYLCRVEE